MRYLALAADYDGTVAHDGTVGKDCLRSLERLRDSGRKLILVTGRELSDLLNICPEITLFERVVAENGGVLYNPAAREEKVLGAPPPAELIRALERRKVAPLSVGRVLLASREPFETAIMEAIRDLGLEYHVIFNKGAVMALPSGITKATGLCAALDEIGLSAHNVMGIGDGENDHAFLEMCGCFAAVGDAVQSLRSRADWIAGSPDGAGVRELIDLALGSDLQTVQPHLKRHHQARGNAQDELDPAQSFYFRGPGNRMNLRAQNINVFIQMTEGLDDETWLYHLRRGDYSLWFAHSLNDADLADAAAAVESDLSLSCAQSRARIIAAIRRRYPRGP